MARRAAVGIIGCGNIAEQYLKLYPNFRNLAIVACADIVPEVAKARAEQYSIRAMSVDELLKNDEIDVLINLTLPESHFDVSMSILSAGKHAYSEKPLTLAYKQAKKLVQEADKRGLVFGGAPDTFLGSGNQTARKLLDKGTIGTVIAGAAQVMSHGMEHWHPNPGFFFKPGAGPIFDVGPYYITGLVNLLGAVKRVTAMAKKGFDERTITSEPRRGQTIKVTTPTTISAILEFRSGAQVTLGGSWDVWKHGHANPIELYGETGTMLLPDPNFFGGTISYSEKNGEYVAVDASTLPFGIPNWPSSQGPRANYRNLGVADMVDAINQKREPRCSGRLAAHVVDIMESILTSAAERRFVKLASDVERPAPLTAADAKRIANKGALAPA